ncbi:unnamed protein product [Schistocephalus solidus]|uniref:S1 motif domain-containing protein n=1 Tax=Schistocephalus solidus TaxID=70667 RepID=A0A183TGZ0_SCHSO|nr:unnamed protein product [Schistocephalus solidus]
MDCSQGHAHCGLHTSTFEKVPVSSLGDADLRLLIMSISNHRVKGFRQILGGSVTVPAEAILAFREQVLVKVTGQTIEKATGEDLPGDVAQRDASVVITELKVPLPLVEMDDGRVCKILRHLSLVPHLLEEFCEFCHQPGPTVLVDFLVGLRRIPVLYHWKSIARPGCFLFLSLSDHSGTLHLPQPLLHKAPASEEGCFGGVSPKVQ